MRELADASSNSGPVIAVFGDAMLDRFVEGRVTRLSPEAPVPVLLRGHETLCPGGAANLAANIAAQGGLARLFGVIGQDGPGNLLRQILRDRGIGDRMRAIKSRPTTEKTRFTSQGKHLLRVDTEMTGKVGDADVAGLLADLESTLDTASALVISDYGKGVVSEDAVKSLVLAARNRGVPVLADPSGRDFGKYAGVSVLSPNAAEMSAATGCDPFDMTSLGDAAQRLRSGFGIEALVVTCGARGLIVADSLGTREVRGRAREVFEVSGAGDTVIATLACTLSEGASLMTAARRANIAGGLSVSRRGTIAPTRSEIDAENAHLAGDKTLRQGTELLARLARWRGEGLRVGFTNGCFDLLHPGHLELLKFARARCDRLIVGLNSDSSVARLKGPTRPYQDEMVRSSVLSALDCVDAVTVFSEDTPLDLLKQIRPDVLFKGADYSRDQVVGGDLVEACGGEVVLVPLVPGHSTTATALFIHSRHADAAE